MILLVLLKKSYCSFGDKKVIITLQSEPKLYLYAASKEKARMKYLSKRKCDPETMIYAKEIGDEVGLLFNNGNFLFAKTEDPGVILKDIKGYSQEADTFDQFKWFIKRHRFGYKIMNGNKCLEVRGDAEYKTKYLNTKMCADIPEQIFEIEVCYDLFKGRFEDEIMAQDLEYEFNESRPDGRSRYYSFSFTRNRPSILSK